MNPGVVRRGGLLGAASLFAALLSAASPAPAFLGLAGGEIYTVRLSVGSTGFEPGRISVPLGAVRFVVTSREGDHCFAIPSLDVEKRVRASKPLEVEVAFDRTGEYPFLCCVEGPGSPETGVLVVTPGK